MQHAGGGGLKLSMVDGSASEAYNIEEKWYLQHLSL